MGKTMKRLFCAAVSFLLMLTLVACGTTSTGKGQSGISDNTDKSGTVSDGETTDNSEKENKDDKKLR